MKLKIPTTCQIKFVIDVIVQHILLNNETHEFNISEELFI